MADSILDFLKISPRLFEHEKTFALADLMNLSALETWPRIVLLWAWAAKHSPTDGDVTFLSSAGSRHGILARVLEFQDRQMATDFFDGMVEKCFIDDRDGRFFLHDWKDGIGGFFIENERKRITARNRMRLSRERSANVPRMLHENSRLNEMNSTELNITRSVSANADSLRPFQEIVKAYHEICKGFPAVCELNDKRKLKIKTAWKRHPDLEYWKSVFEKAQASQGMIGQQWANFDFMFWRDVEILEGKYEKSFDENGAKTEEVEMNLDPNVLTVERLIELCREICYGVPGFKAPLLPREMDESARWKFQKTKKLIQEKIREHPTVEYWKNFFNEFAKTDYFNGGLYHLLKKENGK